MRQALRGRATSARSGEGADGPVFGAGMAVRRTPRCRVLRPRSSRRLGRSTRRQVECRVAVPVRFAAVPASGQSSSVSSGSAPGVQRFASSRRARVARLSERRRARPVRMAAFLSAGIGGKSAPPIRRSAQSVAARSGAIFGRRFFSACHRS